MSRLLFDRRLRDPRMVPTGPVRLNRGHPLAFTEGYVLGSSRGFGPFVGNVGALLPKGGSIAGSPFGPGYMTPSGTALGAVSPSVSGPLLTGNGLTFVWVGALTATPSSDATFGGMFYNAGETSPYYNFVIKVASSTSPGGIGFEANRAGTRISIGSGVSAIVGAPLVIIATAVFGGAISVYQNSALVLSSTWSGGPPSISGPPVLTISDPGPYPRTPNTITCSEYFYNFAITPAQIPALAAAPFSMLESAVPLVMWDVGASGGTFNVNLAEAGSALDSFTGAGLFAGSLAEAGSAVDAISGAGVFGAMLAEAGAATDVRSSAAAPFSASMAEGGNATDGYSAYIPGQNVVVQRMSARARHQDQPLGFE